MFYVQWFKFEFTVKGFALLRIVKLQWKRKSRFVGMGGGIVKRFFSSTRLDVILNRHDSVNDYKLLEPLFVTGKLWKKVIDK